MNCCCIFVQIAGDVTCQATIPFDMEVEAHFLAKEDGIVAGIALADMIFDEVDPSLRVQMHCSSLCLYRAMVFVIVHSCSSLTLG